MSFSANSNVSSFSKWKLTYFILGSSILLFVGIILFNGFSEVSIRSNIRWSARISLLCFCLAFGASAFNSIVQNPFSRWILKNRKYLGVSFALIHLIHLVFLILLHFFHAQIFIRPAIFELILGGLAYFFIVLMLFTSFEIFSKPISKAYWNKLHTIGGYWILIVFSNSMIGRVVSGEYKYIPFAVLILSVWLIRINGIFSGRIAKET